MISERPRPRPDERGLDIPFENARTSACCMHVRLFRVGARSAFAHCSVLPTQAAALHQGRNNTSRSADRTRLSPQA